MENDQDDEVKGYGKAVVGKTAGKGLKMTLMKFDMSTFLALQLNSDNPQNVWIYESNLFLRVKDTSGGSGWQSQVTKIHPVVDKWTNIIDKDNDGRLTSEQNIKGETGSFDELVTQPTHEKTVVATFTDTIRTWINQMDVEYNEQNYGFALVNEYTEDLDERFDAMDVRYYGWDNETDWTPYIDVCYEPVPIERCEESDKEDKIYATKSVVIINDGENHENDSLSFGTHVDGTKRRTLIQFNIDEISENTNFDVTDLSEAWISITLIGITDGEESEISERDFSVYRVTEDWDESATWADTSDIGHDPTPAGSGKVYRGQVDGSKTTFKVTDLIKDWIDNTEDNFGIIIIDDNEDVTSRVPLFTDDNHQDAPYVIELHVCYPIITTTSTTPSSSSIFTESSTSGPASYSTQAAFNAERCAKKTVHEPSQKVTVPDPDVDGKYCVSQEPIDIYLCEDTQNTCKKEQARNTESGELEVICTCCLPELTDRFESFDCFNRTESINIQKIHSCKCWECSSDQTSESSLRRERQKRAAAYRSAWLL